MNPDQFSSNLFPIHFNTLWVSWLMLIWTEMKRLISIGFVVLCGLEVSVLHICSIFPAWIEHNWSYHSLRSHAVRTTNRFSKMCCIICRPMWEHDSKRSTLMHSPRSVRWCRWPSYATNAAENARISLSAHWQLCWHMRAMALIPVVRMIRIIQHVCQMYIRIRIRALRIWSR